MQTTLSNHPRSNKQGNWHELVIDLAVYSHILLFFYTAFSKLITYPSFLKVLSDLPVIGQWHELMALTVIFSEILFGLLLIFPASRIRGLWCALSLMILFTLYLGYHIAVKSKLPCSCGGVISGLSWPQHVIFNIGFILLGVAGILADKKLRAINKIFSRGSR